MAEPQTIAPHNDYGKLSFSNMRRGLPVDKLALILALAAVFALFSFLRPESFPTPRNVETIARQTAIVGMAGLGMTIIIIAGGIDLSVGSIVALVTVAIAALLKMETHYILAAIGGVLVGAACGLINGLFVTGLRVVPFIVTLGSLLLYRGVAKGVADEQKIDAPLTPLENLLASLPQDQKWMLLPPGVWLLVLCAFVVALLLLRTIMGRRTFAIGSNEAAARLCGVPVARVKLMVYTLGGLFAGLAGLLQFSRLTVGDPTVAVGLELEVIAAVVIGGASLSGGQGSVIGTIVGALIMSTIRSGCTQMGWHNWVQEIVTGGIIVAAVTLDRFRRTRRSS